MTTTTIDRNNTSVYYPLCEPFTWYHGHVVKSFSALPQEGAFFELIKRIIAIVLIPVAYPLLGCLWLIGRLIPIHTVVSTSRENPKITTDSISEEQNIDVVKKYVRASLEELINHLKPLHGTMQQAKIFFSLETKSDEGPIVNDTKQLKISSPAEFDKIISWMKDLVNHYSTIPLGTNCTGRFAVLYQKQDGLWWGFKGRCSGSVALSSTKTESSFRVTEGGHFAAFEDKTEDALSVELLNNFLLKGVGYPQKPGITLDQFMNIGEDTPAQESIASKTLQKTCAHLKSELANLDPEKPVKVFIALKSEGSVISTTCKPINVDDTRKLEEHVDNFFSIVNKMNPDLEYIFSYLIASKDADDFWNVSNRSLRIPTEGNPKTNEHFGDEVVGTDAEMTSEYINLILEKMHYDAVPDITLDQFMNM